MRKRGGGRVVSPPSRDGEVGSLLVLHTGALTTPLCRLKRSGLPDPAVYQLAVAQQRILVTFNTKLHNGALPTPICRSTPTCR